MGFFAFFLLLTLASLLWSAACTAAAARSDRSRSRGLWLFLALALPVLALLPFLAATAYLAFGIFLRPNWFGPVLTVVLSTLIGGIWITRAGMASVPPSNAALAERWPVIGLFGLAILAKGVSFGTLLILDNAVAAEARAMRVEAATMMQTAVPPAVADADNAARLHAQAAATIAATPDITAADGPINDRTIDVTSTAIGDLLARHADLLETIRRAADLPGCRFPRDWTRPSVDMLLPEVQAARTEVRFLAVAVRREVADGKLAEAIADTVRIARIGRQVGSEPILISHLVGVAIDGVALDVLSEILPRLGPEDVDLLDAPDLRDALSSVPTLARALVGEEAFGLATFADFADGRSDFNGLWQLTGSPDLAPGTLSRWVSAPASLLFRVFLLPFDVASHRRMMHDYRQLASLNFDRSQQHAEQQKQIAAIEAAIQKDQLPGIVSGILKPAMAQVFQSQTRDVARHRAAAALVAATKRRLETGSLPESLEALVPGELPTLPLDPFTADAPLRLKATQEEFLVWSVGPDGEDDGGPQPVDAEHDPGNDDIGLRMTVGAPATP